MSIGNNSEQLTIRVGQYVGQLREVEVWAGGERLTGEDSLVYPLSFVTAISATEQALRAQLNFMRYEDELFGLGIDAAFERVSSGSLHSKLRMFSWGPTTDSFLCFLLPLNGRLQLAWKSVGSDVVRSITVVPFDLICALRSALEKLAQPKGEAVS